MSGTAGLDRRQAAEALHRRLASGVRGKGRARRFVLNASRSYTAVTWGLGKRAFDILASLLFLTLASPVWCSVIVLMRARRQSLVRTRRAGRWAIEFEEYSFPAGSVGGALRKVHVHRLPALWNILRGDMSLIGPRAVVPGELSPRELANRRRYAVRPGLICLWWVRKRANIAYDSEPLSDSEYVESHGFWGDIGLALRAIPALFYGQGAAAAADELNLVGIRIRNLTMTEAVETILSWCTQPAPRQVAFVNADCANLAWKSADYTAVLNGADLTLGDGIGIKLGATLLGQQLKQNVNGTDLFPRLCESLEGNSASVFLLGARPGVPEAVSAWIARHYPRVNVAGCQHGYYDRHQESDVLARIRESGAAILLVALGAPAQDVWIRKNLPATGVKVALGVGGLFDFFSGRIPRAPQWMREMGLEWVFRLYQEPGRMWRRYLIGNLTFLIHLGLQRKRRSSGNRNTNQGNLA